MKIRNNYIAYNRGWNTVKRHLPIVLKPLVWSTLLATFWALLIWPDKIGFSKESENPLLFIVLPLVSFIYVIFAGIAIGSVFDEYKELSRAVTGKDKRSFMLHRDEQLPIVMHILLWVPSTILIVMTMLFHYSSFFAGLFTVFSVAFIIITSWVVCVDLDDYIKSIWFKEKVPKGWLEEDVDKFFKSKID